MLLKEPVDLMPFNLLSRDLKKAAATLSAREARYLVDGYYILQDARERFDAQARIMDQGAEPHEVLTWFGGNTRGLEDNIKKALGSFAEGRPEGRWALSITGIGPVLAAGLIANIDITRSPKVSNLWSFAGFNPEAKWEKGEKRPWNPALKVLGYKIGESFVKFQNNPHDHYGKYFRQWKDAQILKNEQGAYAERAPQILATRRFKKGAPSIEHLKAGHLPPAHLHAMARRQVIKLFLSHYWAVAYTIHYGQVPDLKPYVFDHLGHQTFIPIPNWEN